MSGESELLCRCGTIYNVQAILMSLSPHRGCGAYSRAALINFFVPDAALMRVNTVVWCNQDTAMGLTWRHPHAAGETPHFHAAYRHHSAQRSDRLSQCLLVLQTALRGNGSRIVDIIAFFTRHLRFKTACSIQSVAHKRLFTAVNHMAMRLICVINFLLKKLEKTGYSGFHRNSSHPVCLQCESCLCSIVGR